MLSTRKYCLLFLLCLLLNKEYTYPFFFIFFSSNKESTPRLAGRGGFAGCGSVRCKYAKDTEKAHPNPSRVYLLYAIRM